jgi:hypothetical protein
MLDGGRGANDSDHAVGDAIADGVAEPLTD